MDKRIRSLACGLLAASALVAPQAALARPVSSVEARLDRLEAELTALRGDLAQSRSEAAAATRRAEAAEARANLAEAQGAAAVQRVAALETKPAPAPAAPADGFRSGNTTIRLGGYVKLLATSTHYSDGEVATNSLGRDFYLPQTIPTGGQASAHDTDFTAKQSRFWLNLDSSVAGHALKGYLEFDFQTSPGTQGSQRTTNGYNPALRRAYMQLDRWTFGQDWTTFQYTGALPESTDYVGGAEGTVFVRQPLIRYSAPLGTGTTLHASLENPESGTASLGSPTLAENGDDRLPDFAVRLAHTGKRGELSLAALGRQVRVENAGISAQTSGWGVSAGGKLFLNDDKTGDVRVMVTYGRNIGRYVGLNFAPDAVYVPATNSLESATVLAAIGAVRVPLAPGLRANLMGSYQSVDYSDALSAASLASFNKRAWSAAANLFYSPVKNIDLGIEYRHGERKLVGGADGTTDRLEVAAKYSF
ncbi:MAG TPA: DcaP family trimeric outer membrane transporter [Novosphingobium sp.]|nr:DcaP family trimeric outer membrane transporter [Novosphingobium sp.]HPZ46409.1 DcaP family trimeric outer membrane transporter [Novosphingobium sp.]HQD98894.1 DcaP family trimeric outer membrane transporter [Novosphingobium sp.]